MTSNTYAPDTDAPYAADNATDDTPDDVDNDATYPRSIQLSLHNHDCNRNRKIAPNTKKKQ